MYATHCMDQTVEPASGVEVCLCVMSMHSRFHLHTHLSMNWINVIFVLSLPLTLMQEMPFSVTVHVKRRNMYILSLFCLIAANNCSDPGTLTNGQHSLSNTTYNSVVTAVVTYTCDVGYALQGLNSRTCQSDGQWNGSVPQCNRTFYSGDYRYKGVPCPCDESSVKMHACM